MGYEQQRIDIESRFNSAWGVTTPIAWQNVGFTPPTSGSWVRLSILNGDSNQISVGSTAGLYRNAGVISISVFTEANQGTKAGLTLADQAAAVFRGAFFGSGIKCRSPRITDLGLEGKYYRHEVSIPFMRDEQF